MIRIYGYQGCGTCRKAYKWLEEQGLEFEKVAIRETPPSREEFAMALSKYESIRKLFNTSGMDYRSMGLKDSLPGMSDEDALDLLGSNGNLVKRPFVISGSTALVGFNEGDWSSALL
ncbi:arsenate reductase [Rubritalea squalenifaciens DSM 18772]|uniref:Arsenate reductase n=1 Tax=Rubritalea squalenifaciens DSM 18772 TaxID=1123071 RepID=A0A1M6H205_9BACT|nr:arsenate reductase family protein [Rubritalea squalenifaciens]SHJ16195.1 arsenate reductase [Rubritalea squalenifaciens DSM 18772]